MTPRYLTVAILAVLMTNWELAAARSMIGMMFFPPPSVWIGTGFEMVADGTLTADIRATGGRLVRGLVIGASLGYLLGVTFGVSRFWHAAIDPFVAFIHPLPKITLYPLLLIVLGLGERPKIAVISIAAFFPILVTTVLGVRAVDLTLHEIVRSFGASRRLMLRRLVVPASIAAAITGLRLSFNSALTSAIALEFVSFGNGLGARIWTSWQNLRTDRLLVAMTTVALLGFLANSALRRLHARLAPWDIDANQDLNG
jgi:ABC-type nitrate/sulfonate/bicarbonate transport system permease component